MNINLNLKIKKIEIKGDNILNLPDQNQSTNHYENNSNKEKDKKKKYDDNDIKYKNNNKNENINENEEKNKKKNNQIESDIILDTNKIIHFIQMNGIQILDYFLKIDSVNNNIIIKKKIENTFKKCKICLEDDQTIKNKRNTIHKNEKDILNDWSYVENYESDTKNLIELEEGTLNNSLPDNIKKLYENDIYGYTQTYFD